MGIENYELAVGYWAAAQAVKSDYSYDSEAHLRTWTADGSPKQDACRLDPESVINVSFGVGESGRCDTCSYQFVQATFRASCICRQVKDKYFSVDLESKNLAEVLQEIMTAQPYVIETF